DIVDRPVLRVSAFLVATTVVAPEREERATSAERRGECTLTANTTTVWTEHPVLEGPRVRLEPLAEAHAPGLLTAADDPDSIFEWAHVEIRSIDDAIAFVREGIADPNRLPYAIVDRTTGDVVGSTSYYFLEPQFRTLVI